MLRFEIVQVLHRRGSPHQWRKRAHHVRYAARERSKALRGSRKRGRDTPDHANIRGRSILSCAAAKLLNMHFGARPSRASKSQAERSGVSCKLTESLPFIRWLHFDKAAREITDQIRAYPVLLRRWSMIWKGISSGRDPIGGRRFPLAFAWRGGPAQTGSERRGAAIIALGAASLLAARPPRSAAIGARRGKKPARSL
jgi:hypothetical protein